ncbi:hypothetical protein BKH41_03830 [Helicobacter sp. 12S02232-10]|uniref:hypothetical protein n=1 Tax=Helicobacter sp. 12S02232-10 TaxID=1476197 RepID=UPI000BA69F73|nr:hypothetical protein [Helicobacter sp. 12S02232-10]PAF49220.1 hypothetical protein BKH41_03830 [Helicobacter sp. 12S02232-10]
MQYQILYDTQLWGIFHPKGKVITFPAGTDPNYITRLVRDKVIIEVIEATEATKQSQEPAPDSDKEESIQVGNQAEEQSDSQSKSKKAKK